MPGSTRQNKMFEPSPVKNYIQEGNPFAVTSCGRRRNLGQKLFEIDSPLEKRKRKRKRKPDVRRTIGPGKNFNKAKSTGTGGKAGGGMTEKGVKEYRRKNPGSKLKTAVTTPPSRLKPGSKAAKRRKSFCARSRGWKSKRGLAARRRWNC
tara:strand:- start:250 stop:699 length:450 start_codon:yes stop_codon:yes gene_type:complete